MRPALLGGNCIYPTRVSIHALARGATVGRALYGQYNNVSIHAPARGATLNRIVPLPILQSFNPRTRTGCDQHRRTAQGMAGRFQSTHPHGVRQGTANFSVAINQFQSTHPHGVRPDDDDLVAQLSCSFNPRTRTGCDAAAVSANASVVAFQSTHPHGVRHHRGLKYQSILCFNPRTRTGCDSWTDGPTDESVEFQSTHPHGVRQ